MHHATDLSVDESEMMLHCNKYWKKPCYCNMQISSCFNLERLLCFLGDFRSLSSSSSFSLLFLPFSLLFLFVLSPPPSRSLSLSLGMLSVACSFRGYYLVEEELSLPKLKKRNRFCLSRKKDKTLDVFLCFILLLCRVARDPKFSLSLQMLSCTHIVMSCFHVSPVTVTRHGSPVTPPSINHVFTASQK